MYIYSTSKNLSRLCLHSFEIVKQSRRKLHVSDLIFASKKLHSIKGKSESSTRWQAKGFYRRKPVYLEKKPALFGGVKLEAPKALFSHVTEDPFVHQAVKDGYRCCSAYKLLEIDGRFHFLTPGSRVVDCGASPGSWTQVALQRIKCNKNIKESGIVVAVDLLDIKEIPGCITLGFSDFTHSDVQQRIVQFLSQGQADVVMSDMAPPSTGHKKLDHSKIVDLNRSALEFARTVLSEGGCFLCKLWDGNETADLIQEISECFSLCKQIKPKASRMDSSEFYIFSKGFIKK